ncbi:KipI antagonist [Roseovarius sp. THAF27]|uniref:5-oxoprolinase subunit C family protein n=1 Tax=Roseovarius sp. THAF27 TaxID=2587850 RepID=UPI001267B1C2|nr:biotin-dependent carboxyltransferase family protein [Roseovarius sp. THAF27]QFT79958.1 KipI antagonist [Roseovarius sp. THAF27]
MSRALIVRRAGPGLTLQDRGRPGYMGFGLSPGGAADRLALAEGAALLGQDDGLAALEMAGMGGEFEAESDMRIALTGAPMRAAIDGTRVAWHASHALPAGARLTIGGAEAGSYGYLHVGGGFGGDVRLGSRSVHVASGLGQAVESGARLEIGEETAPAEVNRLLPVAPRFEGGTVRVVPSLQTDFFDADQIERFETTRFKRDARGSRMGVRLDFDGEGFHSDAGLSVLSEVVVPGDIQITGDGAPFVLLGECQTTGGYPRIASVLPCDLPTVVQATPGTALRFRFVTLEEAVEAERRAAAHRNGLRSALTPLVRDPHNIRDLLAYQLISGATAGRELEET